MKRIVSLFLCFICITTYITPSASATDISIDAKSALLADPKTGQLLYEKNAREKRYPASTTKIMTALVTLEHAKIDDKVTMLAEDFPGASAGGSSAGLKPGEVVSVLDLLYCIMLPSANEAANALARHVGGDVPTFVNMMNERAKELGCTGTNFMNPNGLHDDNHYTTAYDLFLIARQAMKNETFQTVVNTAQKRLTPNEQNPNGKLIYTTNKLILRRSDPTYYGYCNGIKTGFTTPAGYCFVSTATKNDYTFISVVMGCEKPENTTEKSFTETKRLFEWGFENFKSKTIVSKGDAVLEAPVRLSTDTDHVVLTANNDLSAIVPIDINLEELVYEKNIMQDIKAPIKQGQTLGTMSVSYKGVNYGSIELVSLSDVEMSTVLYYVDKLDNFFKSTFFKVIILGIILFIIFYIVYISLIIKRKQRKKYKGAKSRNSRYRRK